MAVAPGRGRKPKPVARKKAAGNPGGRRLNTAEPDYNEISNVDAPDWLQGPGRSLWEVLAPQLCEQDILKMTDIQNLEAYCAAYGRFREAEESIKHHGSVIQDDSGKLYKNPAVTIVNEATRQMATMGSLLGLDPSSRQRLVGRDGERKGNPFASLLQ